MRSLKEQLQTSYSEFQKDNVARLGAALSYYTAFSLAPLLVIVIAMSGAIWGAEAARGEIFGEIRKMVGSEGAATIESMIEHAYRSDGDLFSSLISFIVLLFGASGVVGELRNALNLIFRLEPSSRESGWILFLREKFFSFGIVLAIGFLLIVSLALSALLTFLQSRTRPYIPGPILFGQLLEIILSLGVTTFAFALLYRFLPNTSLPFKFCLRGGLVASILFVIGKALFALYLGTVATSSTYGAAGAVLIILLWVYYSAQIFLFGGEYLKVYGWEKKFKVIRKNPVKRAQSSTLKSNSPHYLHRRMYS